MIKYILFLAVGFIFLYKGSDIFVDGSMALAIRLRIPAYIIGLTIVAMGTSIPETAVSLTAAIDDNASICIGNVVGSNILNILIILGVSAIIRPLAVSSKTIWAGITFMLLCSVILLAIGRDGQIIANEGAFLLFLFIFYLLSLVVMSWRENEPEPPDDVLDLGLTLLFIIAGLIAVIIGSRLTVYSASQIAHMMNISDRIIGLTVVALGTSLPEFFTSVNAAQKGNTSIAISNIIGSNIYNILFILGLTSLVTNVPYLQEFKVDALVNIATVVLLFMVCVFNKKLSRLGGCILLSGYILYFIFLLITRQ